MGQFSVEKPVAPGSVLSGNQHSDSLMPPEGASENSNTTRDGTGLFNALY